MRVTVDRERCQGHARCAVLCPEVFEVDDLGFATAFKRWVPSELERDARRAVESCPEHAIRVEY